MKIRILLISLYLLCITSLSQAQSSTNKKGFIGGGITTNFLIFNSTTTQESEVNEYFGIGLEAGYYTTAKSFLMFEVGISFHSGEQVGNFVYTKEYDNGKKETFTDGIISRNYRTTPILLSWNYMVNLNPTWYISVGPVMGLTVLSAVNSYSPSVENEPGNQKQRKSTFNYGACIGIAFHVSQNAVLGLNYKALGNTSPTLDNLELKPLGHQCNLTVKWCF